MKYFFSGLLLFLPFFNVYAQDGQLMPYPKNEKFFIYPAEGQSQQQMQEDKFLCYQQAMQETGFDPSAIPHGEGPPPGIKDVTPQETPAGFGGSTGTPDKGYLAGEAKKEWKAEELNKYKSQRSEYNKAYKSCLEKNGYTVN